MQQYIAPFIVIAIAITSLLGYLLIPTTYQECVQFPGSQVNSGLGTCQTFYGAPFLEQTATLPSDTSPVPSTAPTVSAPTDTQADCQPAGCSGQLCVDAAAAGDIITTCEFKEEYACYRQATCERQPDGNCGWTPNQELQTCLDQAGALPEATL